MRRRDLAWFILAGAAPAAAQTAPTQPQPSSTDDLTAARERVKANGAELSKFKIPMATEPAFAFKA